jgi:hypothetical protein
VGRTRTKNYLRAECETFASFFIQFDSFQHNVSFFKFKFLKTVTFKINLDPTIQFSPPPTLDSTCVAFTTTKWPAILLTFAIIYDRVKYPNFCALMKSINNNISFSLLFLGKFYSIIMTLYVHFVLPYDRLA